MNKPISWSCEIVKSNLNNFHQYNDAVRSVWLQIAQFDIAEFCNGLVVANNFGSKTDRRTKESKELEAAQNDFLVAAERYAKAIENHNRQK